MAAGLAASSGLTQCPASSLMAGMDKLVDMLRAVRVFDGHPPPSGGWLDDGRVSPIDCLIEDRPWMQRVRDAQDEAMRAVDAAILLLASGDRDGARAWIDAAAGAERSVFPDADSYAAVIEALRSGAGAQGG